MLKTVVAFLVVLAFAVAPINAASITVVNPGFEICALPSTACALGVNGFTTNTVAGWTLTGSGGQFQTQLVTSPSLADENPHSGNDVAYLLPAANISQDLGAITPGGSYEATVFLSVEDNAHTNVPWTFELLAGSTVIGTASGTITSAGYGIWQQVNIFGTAAGNATGDLTVEILNTGSATNNLNVDDVSVQTTPEPGTYAMLLVGAGLIVVNKFRAQRAKA